MFFLSVCLLNLFMKKCASSTKMFAIKTDNKIINKEIMYKYIQNQINDSVS